MFIGSLQQKLDPFIAFWKGSLRPRNRGVVAKKMERKRKEKLVATCWIDLKVGQTTMTPSKYIVLLSLLLVLVLLNGGTHLYSFSPECAPCEREQNEPVHPQSYTMFFDKYLTPLQRGEPSVGLFEVHEFVQTLRPVGKLRYSSCLKQFSANLLGVYQG
jgi:hypothetical protein